MEDTRRRNPAFILFNGRVFNEVAIDPHYEEGHADINDELILQLVKRLNRTTKNFQKCSDGWSYFEFKKMIHDGLIVLGGKYEGKEGKKTKIHHSYWSKAGSKRAQRNSRSTHLS